VTTWFVDYESRSQLDITKVGTYRYVQDPSTEILFVTYAKAEGPVGDAARAADVPIVLGDVLVHWGSFDRLLARYKEPDLPEVRWFDASVLARMVGRPGKLALCAKSLDLEEKGAGTRLINKYSKPREDGTFLELADGPIDDILDFYAYGRQDTAVLRSIFMKLRHLIPHWKEHQKWIYELVERMNETGVPVDVELIPVATRFLDQAREKDAKWFVKTTGLNPTQTAKVKDWISERLGSKLPNLQAGTLESIHTNDRKLQRVIEIRLGASLASVGKLYSMEAAMVEGRVYDCFVDHGAHTGRLTSLGVQFHNFKKGAAPEGYFYKLEHRVFEHEDNFADLTSQALRGFIKASPGHVLLVSDFRAIEACVGAWLAGETKLLRAFEQDLPVYKYMAMDIFRCLEDEVDDVRRFIGKTAVLGCQYQASAHGLAPMLGEYESEGELAVETYRNTFREIVRYWGRLERAATEAIKRPGEIRRAGVIEFEMWKDYLLARLPSGRCIYYYGAEIRDWEKPWGDVLPTITHMHQNPKTKQWERSATYGGKLMENVTQGTSADVMYHGMQRAWQSGYEPFISVHDEVGVEIPEGGNEAQLTDFNRALCTLPPWAEGLPIKAKGYVSERYRK